ncbi:Rpn family recombination-promoting nuclease/putative transposase [Lentibacillus sp. Marseille-P4043]|uniref:Rpn family recombination-promoting nuclease/putative transposase n=1 Tax=Lentibacillus sp. Marseille-P4043 TaxID=2040293 RepID=UPI0018F8AD6C|nr:Rpn family recombination-promoting nuclease/putative transposase [Lentibacillus sp. Marseille-P4043]
MSVATLVKEESTGYTKHDQLFKQLIHTFFEEFLAAYFPEVHRNIDFQSIKPFSEEVHTDLLEGSTRRLDIVIETKLKGTDTIIIVHVEPQSTTQTDFHDRMFRYFSLLYNKYRKPIIPIAVFSYDESWEKDEYTMRFPFFHVLTFNYMTLHLQKKNWRDYIQSDNPVAAALLSKMGFSNEERIQVKIEFLKMMARMELDPARQRLIYGVFETYLKLNKGEEEELMKEIKQMDDAEKILELPISYEERGIEKGKKIGEQIGKERGEQSGIKKVAREMLKKGLSIEFIAEVTYLEKSEIQRLAKECKENF